jgi:hypothetical protein
MTGVDISLLSIFEEESKGKQKNENRSWHDINTETPSDHNG